jgi:hypothetical protein
VDRGGVGARLAKTSKPRVGSGNTRDPRPSPLFFNLTSRRPVFVSLCHGTQSRAGFGLYYSFFLAPSFRAFGFCILLCRRRAGDGLAFSQQLAFGHFPHLRQAWSGSVVCFHTAKACFPVFFAGESVLQFRPLTIPNFSEFQLRSRVRHHLRSRSQSLGASRQNLAARFEFDLHPSNFDRWKFGLVITPIASICKRSQGSTKSPGMS